MPEEPITLPVEAPVAESANVRAEVGERPTPEQTARPRRAALTELPGYCGLSRKASGQSSNFAMHQPLHSQWVKAAIETAQNRWISLIFLPQTEQAGRSLQLSSFSWGAI
jgi:hypothetical protein